MEDSDIDFNYHKFGLPLARNPWIPFCLIWFLGRFHYPQFSQSRNLSVIFFCHYIYSTLNQNLSVFYPNQKTQESIKRLSWSSADSIFDDAFLVLEVYVIVFLPAIFEHMSLYTMIHKESNSGRYMLKRVFLPVGQ